jgi:hypothetical protein
MHSMYCTTYYVLQYVLQYVLCTISTVCTEYVQLTMRGDVVILGTVPGINSRPPIPALPVSRTDGHGPGMPHAQRRDRRQTIHSQGL